jgi:hypothetical protein
MEKNNINTLEFIQLVKCIIEYYASTKTKETNFVTEIAQNTDEMDEATKLLNSLSQLNMSEMAIEVPVDIDKSIKDAFLAQLKNFELQSQKIN